MHFHYPTLSVTGPCVDVECGTGETCFTVYKNAPPVCVCRDGYAYNPNKGECEG